MARASIIDITKLTRQREADLLLADFRAMRRAARDTIERLINFLDETEPDADLEDDGDREVYLVDDL
jgi:hypothetical protein